jgi:hypothetical protein
MWLFLIVALVTAIVYVIGLFPRRLGYMSDHWLAEYRASRQP